MKVRNVLVAVAVSGLLALAACSQEAQGGASGNPYGSSGKPSGAAGGGGSMSSGSSGGMSSGSSASPMR